MTIKLDVLLIQLINIGILFFVFRKFIGSALTNEIVRRKEALRKLSHAEETYQEMIAKAQEEVNGLIKEGVVRKEALIAEWTLLAQKSHDQIMKDADHKANRIVEAATLKADSLERELKDSYVDGVKKTAQLVVNKLFKNDVSLQDKYMEELVEEFKERS